MTAPTLPAVVPVQSSDPSVEYRESYWKTIIAAGVAALGCDTVLLVLARVHLARLAGDPFVAPIVGVVWVLSLLASAGLFAWAALVFIGGLIAVRRDALEVAGRPYASRTPRESRPSRLLDRLRSVAGLPCEGHVLRLRPGEQVEIKSLEEILATLDANGTLDGLPFMPETAAYCGQRTTVFRRVDKLNDWIHHEGLKRARNMVQLEGLRCPGSVHGGCQANCRLRWKEAWLRRVDHTRRSAPPGAARAALAEADLYRLAHRIGSDGQPGYMCQATELASGTGPPIAADPRHVIRDFTTGNVRLRPLLIGVAIACFNWVQTKRQGVTFPHMEPSTSKHSPLESLGLRPGELVRVKPRASIEKTLNNRNRNRGLSFDREMLRFCGGEYKVASVLERVIVEATGTLKELTTPCIVLEGVTATGEYRGFNPEDEHIFWREIWLERVNAPAPS